MILISIVDKTCIYSNRGKNSDFAIYAAQARIDIEIVVFYFEYAGFVDSCYQNHSFACVFARLVKFCVQNHAVVGVSCRFCKGVGAFPFQPFQTNQLVQVGNFSWSR